MEDLMYATLRHRREEDLAWARRKQLLAQVPRRPRDRRPLARLRGWAARLVADRRLPRARPAPAGEPVGLDCP